MSLKDELILIAQKIEIQILSIQMSLERLKELEGENEMEREYLMYKMDSMFDVYLEIQNLINKHERGLIA